MKREGEGNEREGGKRGRRRGKGRGMKERGAPFFSSPGCD